MEITSVNNDLVKECAKLQQKKYRSKSGKFLLEGFKTIKEAYDYGIKLDHIFVQSDFTKNYSFAHDIVISVSEAVLKKLSTTESTPNAVAVGIIPKQNSEILKLAQRVILLENIKDLGNLGTIIRSATAFGADAIVLYGECADIYNPKCIRSSVGQLWKIPIICIENFTVLKKIFYNFERIATLPRSVNLLRSFKVHTPVLVMFGSEADGLSAQLQDFATDSVKIEMTKTVESLNLATSVSVIMYELFV